MEILNEFYIGRAPIEPLQKQITVIRKKLAGQRVTSTTNVDPEIIKFNRLAEKIFGFKTFSLYVQNDNIPNAYAFPVDTGYSDEEKLKIYHSLCVSPTGFKYNEAFAEVSIIVSINSGLLGDFYYTDEEVMATILHEIGHGFFEAVTNKDNEYSTARKIAAMLSKVNNFARDRIKHGKKVTKDIIDNDLSSLRKLIPNIKNALPNFRSIAVKESMEDNMKRNRVQYTNEKFADTFAAIYGYAEECHSVDMKMYQDIYKKAYGVKTYPKIVETIKMYKLYINDMLKYAFNTQNEHPAELARVMTAIAYIKKELAKESLDPKMKRELIDELNKLNKLVDDFINYPKDEDSMRILRLYYIKLYEKFGGDRRERDTDNDALFDAIDKRYDDLKNGSKGDE